MNHHRGRQGRHVQTYLLFNHLSLLVLQWFDWCRCTCQHFRLHYWLGDADFVLDAAVGACRLHSLTDGTDQILPDTEGLVECVLSHRLAEHRQHVAAVSITSPWTLSYDGQTSGHLRF